MTDMPIDQPPPGRPDHPDFWLISQAVIDTDALSDGGEDTPTVMERIVDPASLTYIAIQRSAMALREFGINDRVTQMLVAGAWGDAFLAGARFQHLRSTNAQELSDTDKPDPPAAT
jgi:hypothetical protein